MFGKRAGAPSPTPAPAAPAPKRAEPRAAPVASTATRPATDPAAKAGSKLAPQQAPKPGNKLPAKAAPRTARAAADPVGGRSEEYYAIKTTIFNALIDTIDLGQLSRLDQETAAEEIRDIVTEIISIKNVAMSIAEQEQLLQDICNDVLGYGPLEPLPRQCPADEYLSAHRQPGRPPRR